MRAEKFLTERKEESGGERFSEKICCLLGSFKVLEVDFEKRDLFDQL